MITWAWLIVAFLFGIITGYLVFGGRYAIAAWVAKRKKRGRDIEQRN